MWQNLCECLMKKYGFHPSIEEVLQSIQDNTVCTATQCFDSEESAFGLMQTNQYSTNSNISYALFAFMFIMFMLSHIPITSFSNKPTFTHTNIIDEQD